jgi:hypothetical protein
MMLTKDWCLVRCVFQWYNSVADDRGYSVVGDQPQVSKGRRDPVLHRRPLHDFWWGICSRRS